MKICRTLAAVLGCSSVSFPAHAVTVLASGGVFGGPGQDKAFCQVFNVGRDVTINVAEIIAENGTVLPQLRNTCNGTLFRFNTCVVASEIENDASYACRIVIRRSNANVRGALDLRDAADNVLVSSPLR